MPLGLFRRKNTTFLHGLRIFHWAKTTREHVRASSKSNSKLLYIFGFLCPDHFCQLLWDFYRSVGRLDIHFPANQKQLGSNADIQLTNDVVLFFSPLSAPNRAPHTHIHPHTTHTYPTKATTCMVTLSPSNRLNADFFVIKCWMTPSRFTVRSSPIRGQIQCLIWGQRWRCPNRTIQIAEWIFSTNIHVFICRTNFFHRVADSRELSLVQAILGLFFTITHIRVIYSCIKWQHARTTSSPYAFQIQ